LRSPGFSHNRKARRPKAEGAFDNPEVISDDMDDFWRDRSESVGENFKEKTASIASYDSDFAILKPHIINATTPSPLSYKRKVDTRQAPEACGVGWRRG
jgi:hypothetical protein